MVGDAAGADVRTWVRAVVRAVYLGGFGYLLIAVWQTVLVGAGGLTAPATVGYQIAGQLAVLLGGCTLAAGYLWSTDRDRSVLDLAVPSLRQGGLVVVGIGVLLGLNYAAEALGVVLAEHAIQTYAAQNPAILPALVVGSLLFVGPGEELLFRNVVQRVTVDDVGPVAGIAVTSVVFAAVHTAAYAGAPLASFLGTLGVVFALSVVLGAIYERTRNLAVVALVHGGYDAVAFTVMYLEYAG